MKALFFSKSPITIDTLKSRICVREYCEAYSDLIMAFVVSCSVRRFYTRDGKRVDMLDLKIADESCGNSVNSSYMSFQLWGQMVSDKFRFRIRNGAVIFISGYSMIRKASPAAIKNGDILFISYASDLEAEFHDIRGSMPRVLLDRILSLSKWIRCTAHIAAVREVPRGVAKVKSLQQISEFLDFTLFEIDIVVEYPSSFTGCECMYQLDLS
jgi:hypothetical protein